MVGRELQLHRRTLLILEGHIASPLRRYRPHRFLDSSINFERIWKGDGVASPPPSRPTDQIAQGI